MSAVDQSEPKLSVISAVMNRTERAIDGVSNWLESPEVSEVILVDWSSRPPVKPTDLPDDPRLTLVTVLNEPTFVLTQAFNLAASFASGDTLVKMDSDYRVDRPEFFQSVRKIVRRSKAMRGSWQAARDDNEKCLNGFLAVSSTDFWRTGGYNEKIVGWGFDDDDLYRRLHGNGVWLHVVKPTDGIFHVPHNDNLRVKNVECQTKWVSHRRNSAISKVHRWSPESKRVEWTECASRSQPGHCKHLTQRVVVRCVPEVT